MKSTNALLLLSRIEALNRSAIQDVRKFLRHVALAARYAECLEKRNVDVGFNLFAIVSRLYYRENFHSDILGALIDPNGKHNEKDKYLRLFLDFLSSQGAAINLSHYAHAEIVREQGKVDLLIKDDDSRRAIIIENKINNAGDMHRQIPRYLEYVTGLGYACDSIIYLRLNGHADPDTTDWTDQERLEVKALLRVVRAYDETENDLFNGWVSKCAEVSENIDAMHIFRQYGQLIKKLGGNVMNKPVMEQFYQIVSDGDTLKTAISLKSMLDDLILFRVEKIIDTFKGDLAPFHKIANWHNDDAYFTDLFWKDGHLGLDIQVQTESYSFLFWDRKDPTGKKGVAKAILQKMKCLGDYDYTDGGYTKRFDFPVQEKELYDHIKAFKTKLSLALNTGANSQSVEERSP